VYVAGYCFEDRFTTTGRYGNPIPRYPALWKNSDTVLPLDLLPGSDWGTAMSVFAAGENVYVAGYVVSGDNYTAVVWENGIPKKLVETPNTNSQARAVYVYDGAVYAAGVVYTANTWEMVVWKDGEILYNIPNPATSPRQSYPKSIFVTNK